VRELPARRSPGDAMQGYREARYAIDRFEIVLLPSVRFLAARPRSAAWRGARVLVVSNKVSGRDREVAAIKEAWSSGGGAGRVTVLSDSMASETKVQRASSAADIWHFATHAIANADDPLSSHLALSPDASNDGFYHAAEIAEHQRPARLVILSACETQVGPVYEGEGFMGLARAFLASGSTGVIATLWPVDATAADLAGSLHRGLAAGAPPARALRAAKLRLRESARHAHPFFWAGYQLTSTSGT
jgi:CHAT domain-containing protein